MIKHQDEILLPAVSSDRTAVPRYDVVAPDGQKIHENVALRLANGVTQPGTPINKPLLDEFLAASGITAGSATAYTLAQEGYSLFDGATVRFRLHTASGGNATLNINGTGAKPLRDVLGETMNEGIPAGTWLTATYSAAAGAYIIMSGGVKKSIDEAINGEQYTVDDAVGYVKDVPENVLSYAEISEIGGMTYKDGNTLRSAAVTEVESVGANLFDADNYNVINGYFTTNTQAIIEASQTKIVYVRCMPNTIYTVSKRASARFSVGFTQDVPAAGVAILNVQSGSTGEITTCTAESPDDAQYMAVWVYHADHDTLTLDEILSTFMINRGAAAMPYTPYFRDTLLIPEAVRALDGYGWGINETVRNYVDWENRKFVKMVERVDLGTLTWNKVASYASRFITYDIHDNANTNNGICDRYPVGTSSVDKRIFVYSEKVYVDDNSYTDAASLKASLSGVMLYYELATPIITDISSLLPADNILCVQSGGTVTPINEHGYAVPSTITYQNNVLNNRASTFEVEKVRAQQNGITVTLAAGAWSGNTQTIAVPGVTADNTVICSPDPASHDAYGKYGVYCISQADGQLAFRCKRTPDIALAVNIIAMGG
jgi:hypothetical protein